jgi:hypothetical protein
MANNTNAQAILFCNQKARPTADAVVQMYETIKTLVLLWGGQNINAIIPNDANLVQDGATVASGTPDGRPPITDAQIQTMISNCNTIIATFEATSNLLLNQFLQIAVNTQSRI